MVKQTIWENLSDGEMNLLQPTVLITEKIEEKLFEFESELIWLSLYFWQPNAITLRSMDRDAYQQSTDWLDFAFCECHQPEFLWRLSGKYVYIIYILKNKNIAESHWKR